MLFSDYEKVWPVFSCYSHDTKMLSAELSKIVVNHNVFPEDASSIGNNKLLLYKKLYSEYFERRTIGFNSFKDKKTFYTNYENDFSIKRRNIGYGETDDYGLMDTTGTASGLSSDALKYKSISEL